MIAALDTNVLLYANDSTAGDKRPTVIGVIDQALDRRDIALPLQVLGEFAAAAMRRQLVPIQDIADRIAAWRVAFPVLPGDPDDILPALALAQRHQLQFWDAMIITACARNGIRWLVTEDMQDGFVTRGVRLVNPFKPHNTALLQEIGLA